MSLEETTYGFKWGCIDIRRLCSDKSKGWKMLALDTPRHMLEIYVTKTGMIKIHDQKTNRTWGER